MSSKLKFVPLLVFLMFPSALIFTYTMGIIYDHIRPFFSYISDTGAIAPESCWFSFFLNLVGIGLGFTSYIRYKQVEEYFRTRPAGVWMPRINTIGLILGIISALGVTVVGSYQETRAFVGHVIGAFMCFLGGAIYLCFQAYFTFKMLPMFCNKLIAILRLIIGVSCIVLFAAVYSCGVVSVSQFTGEDIVHWNPDEGGWTLRIISVTCEWIMAALFDLYILSFMLDFDKIHFTAPQFKLESLPGSGGQGATPLQKKFIQVRYDDRDVDV